MRLLVSSAVISAAAALAVASAAPARADEVKLDSGHAIELSSQNRPRARNVQRPRSRITVRPRSYLDPGTEVFPNSRGYTDYVYPPTYSAFSTIDPTGASRWPLPAPFELRSYHSPTGF